MSKHEYSILRLGPLGLLEHTVNGKTKILYRGPYAEAKKLLIKAEKGEIIPKQDTKRLTPEFEPEC